MALHNQLLNQRIKIESHANDELFSSTFTGRFITVSNITNYLVEVRYLKWSEYG